jgi:aryl-alcohol dehydrogenase-like predicted oxidoreductase
MRQRQHIWQDAPWDALEQFQAFCDERGITMLEATFGWLLAHEALASVIAGSTSAEQVRANAAAATAWTPTAADLVIVDELFPLPADPGAQV